MMYEISILISNYGTVAKDNYIHRVSLHSRSFIYPDDCNIILSFTCLLTLMVFFTNINISLDTLDKITMSNVGRRQPQGPKCFST